ncbi:MAG: hypothetical protein P8173_18255 [Gammaproteobacteria bacterium]|jgi:hypothetical protein
MDESRISDLKSFAQAFQFGGPLGKKGTDKATREIAFNQVQRRVDRNFYFYLGILVVLFLAVLVLAFVFRKDLGQIEIVLGGGGVLLLGILTQMGKAWKKKAEMDLFAILLYGLPEDQLGVVLGLVAKGQTRPSTVSLSGAAT